MLSASLHLRGLLEAKNFGPTQFFFLFLKPLIFHTFWLKVFENPAKTEILVNFLIFELISSFFLFNKIIIRRNTKKVKIF